MTNERNETPMPEIDSGENYEKTTAKIQIPGHVGTPNSPREKLKMQQSKTHNSYSHVERAGDAGGKTTAYRVSQSGENWEKEPNTSLPEGSYARQDSNNKRVERVRETASMEAPVYSRVLLDTINPWTVLKVAFMTSFFFGFVIIAACWITWSLVQELAIIDQLNTVITTVTTGEQSTSLNLYDFIDTERVLMGSLLLAVSNVLLMTVGSFFLAVFYNVTSRLVGGLTFRLTQS